MAVSVLVVDCNPESCEALCRLLAEERYAATKVTALERLEPFVRRGEPSTLLLDLDSTQAGPSFIRGLRRRNPAMQIIVLSSRSYHPELQEVMGSHIYACLHKPLDPEELFFVLRSICTDGRACRDSPDEGQVD